MPVKPKPPTVDVPTPSRTSSGSETPRAGTSLHLTPDPFVVKAADGTYESVRVTPEPEVVASTPRVNVQETAVTSAAVFTSDAALLQHYLIPSTSMLPDADAQGFRLFRARQYADVQGGGTVQIGVDPQTGQYRARLASELDPSGPVLVWEPVTRLWHPVPVSESAVLRRGVATHLSDDEFELAPESLPDSLRRVDDADDEVFELASESMPIKPYTAQELAYMRREDRYTSLGNQLGSYNRANNGKYPLRDSLGRPVRIRTLENKVMLAMGETYASEQIRPYIKFEGYEAVARLYEEKLQLRQFTEADVKVPGERALVGQSMVVANRRLTKGEVVGVYGGTIRSGRFLHPVEQVFTMIIGMDVVYRSGQLGPGPIAVVGDNIISRMNTNFVYDDAGKPLRQAPDGYNIELVGFKIEADLPTAQGVTRKPYLLNAAFATEDIPAGTELRWNYHYTDEDMKMLFG